MGRNDVMSATAYYPSCLKSVCSDGLTVLELVVALGLVGLLGGGAILQMQPLLAQMRLASSARQIATDLQVMRMRAIAQNCRFRVTFRPSTRDYVIDKEEASSWVRLVLQSHTS